MQQTTVFNSTVYRLTAPYVIEEVEVERRLRAGEVAVKPLLGSVCHADLRYFTGNRRPESLAKKLPMALIHEGIGEVTASLSDKFRPGQLVVVVPNIPEYAEQGESVIKENLKQGYQMADNYSENGRFLGSGTDGLAQSLLVMPDICVIPIPEEVPMEIAVLAELSTIPYQALRRVSNKIKESSVAVFGDGPVGYLTAALIHHYYKVSHDRLTVFGAIPEKLTQFDFANRELVSEYDFANSSKFDIAIECTGGRFSSAAINQAIDLLVPGGCLTLLGVTEDLVPINTRDILEKGITVIGSSRSSFRDYEPVLQAMKDVKYQAALKKLLPDQLTPVKSVGDFIDAMKYASEHPHWQKVILDFKW